MTTSLDILAGRRALITAAGNYMGPAIAKKFRAAGADVIEHRGDYRDDPSQPASVVDAAGHVDILVVNLPGGHEELRDHLRTPAHEQGEEHWQQMFDLIVHPTMRFVSAVLPQMIERRAGKIIVVTSASPLRGSPLLGAYCAARGAQNAYVRAVGTEVAPHNIQINAIAQHFTIGGFSEESAEDPQVRTWVEKVVPAGRLARGEEQAALALFLASQDSNFFVGQTFPFAGGWAVT
ncbi:SDR family NAD(P)-dependent oxidoreductase [Novosphingobium malaysiense]|uniref:Short-chain dehydrogenase n=1 Tax=Novosphingobium malaysiense TaxID=1348853 RepID=A0A0B1ZIR3_9SPHN|nr:SDR family oxidoreductase [Novosphingobium malaysiense]KHK89148.1 hypothetical protein LK12_21695 [Novosphingobium malaysiense]